ncbi:MULTISPECIES: CHAT domain-containing protein [unclassified Pseudomonas]|uniref:CHAT domain-containing protein n=1 Tax=unclassified Pseudomonas TaxID=196821 RepID=UPI000A1F78F9|nr:MULTISPECIES: CHAT domain-containing protein [unclassified Pseudomonas]
MFFSPSYLSKKFSTLQLDSSPSDLLQVLANPVSDYIILGDRLQHGGRVQLLVRSALTAVLLERTTLGTLEKRKWERSLTQSPLKIPEFIRFLAMKEFKGNEVFGPRSFINWSLKKFIQYWFGTPQSVPVAEYDSVRRLTSRLRVLIEYDRVVSVYDPGLDTKPRTLDKRRDLTRAFRDFPSPNDSIRTWESERVKFSYGPPVISPPERASPFVAHPRITPFGDAIHEQPLQFSVGFSTAPDADASEQKRIEIDDASPGEKLTVFVSADGAEIDGLSMVELELDMAAEHVFSLRPCAGIKELILRANYFFRNKLVGNIVKKLAVRSHRISDDESSTLPAPVASVSVLPLANPANLEAVDIVLWVQREKPDYVAWSAWVPGSLHKGPFSVWLEQPQIFGMQLSNFQGVFGSPSGKGAYAHLTGIGRVISKLIPLAIRSEVLLPAFADGRMPSILLMTDEPYVPWELASFVEDDSPFKVAGFLGELSHLGRWWSARDSSGPMSKIMINHVSVLASDYENHPSQSPLVHALKERDMLSRDFNGQSIEARLPAVEEWLEQKPRLSGHLAHVALHGYSDVASQTQALCLEDEQILSPYHFAGVRENGLPRFSAVFLNACQVGTAGQQLGFLSGFPGAFVDAGTQAFIAPLWAVQDEVALQVAEKFYCNTLTQGQTVGETFREIRAMARDGGHITHLAYIFYGHPSLRMTQLRINRKESDL